jgi:hypothetical protein
LKGGKELPCPEEGKNCLAVPTYGKASFALLLYSYSRSKTNDPLSSIERTLRGEEIKMSEKPITDMDYHEFMQVIDNYIERSSRRDDAIPTSTFLVFFIPRNIR